MKHKTLKMALVTGIVAASFALSGCGIKFVATDSTSSESSSSSSQEENVTVTPPVAETPADTSKPTDYSGLQNVNFMASRLASEQYYSTEAASQVTTKISFLTYTQSVETYKDYYDGVMVVSDISKSTLVNSALQSCFIGDRVLWREPASSSAKDWNGRATAWSEDTPTNRSVAEYMELYGLPSTDFSVYVLNESTLKDWSDVTDNGDGTYSQTIYPDVNTAGVYYAARMKTMGGLSDYPTFNSIQITYTFDGNWRVLSSVTEEKYSVDMGILHSDSCSAVTTQTYSYDRSSVDISAYTNYFSRYAQKTDDITVTSPSTPPASTTPATPDESVTPVQPNVPESPEKPETQMTALEYLIQGCGTLLSEPQLFDAQATIGGQTISGSVYFDLSTQEARGEIEGTNVWYTGGKLYIAAGEEILSLSPEKLTALSPLTTLTTLTTTQTATQTTTQIATQSTTQSTAKSGTQMSANEILALLNAFKSAELEETEGGAIVTAAITVSDTAMDVAFGFDRTADGVALNYISVATEANGTAIDLTFTVSDGEPIPALTEEQKAAAIDLDGALEYAGDLLTMLQGKNLAIAGTLSVTASGKTFACDVSGTIDWNNGVKACAALQTEIGGKTRKITFYYLDGEIALVSGSVGVQAHASEAGSLTEAVKDLALQWQATPAEIEGLDSATTTILAVLEGFLADADIDLGVDLGVDLGFDLGTQLDAGTLLKGGLKTLAAAIKNGLELNYDGKAFILTATNQKIGNAEIGLEAKMQAGKEIPALPENVKWISAETAEKLLGYLSELSNATSASEWNIGYTASIYTDDEAYAAYHYLQYTVTGDVQVIRASGNFSVSVAAESTVGERNYYINLIVCEGRAYLSVSFYQSGDKEYDPLLLSGNASDLSALLSAAGISETPSVYSLLTTLAAISAEEADEWNISLGGLQADETGVTLTLARPLQNGDISLFLSRAKDGNWSLAFGNVNLKEGTHARVDGEITLKKAACNIAVPTGGYIDLSSIDRLGNALLKTLLNATETTHYFGGTIDCSVGGYDLSFDVGGNIAWADGVKINLSIGANSSFAVNSGKYLSYVTIDPIAGMVYMTRYQYEYFYLLSFRSYASPVVTYRSMTTEEFAEDAWAQIVYLTNMGDTVSTLLYSQIGAIVLGTSAGSSSSGVTKDAGYYLKEYGYNEAENAFTVVLNGSFLADTLGDITLKITCSKEGKIANFYGSLDVGVTLSVNLNYENVTATSGNYTLTVTDLKETWKKENYTMTVKSGVTESASSVLGVADFASAVTLKNGKAEYTVPVQYGAPMSELFDLKDTETACFMGWFTEEDGKGDLVTAETIDNGFGGKTLYAHWENFIAIALDAGEGAADVTSLKVVPSALWQTLQSVEVQRAQYNFLGWTDQEGNFVTAENIADLAKDGATLYAAYEKSLQVTLQSDITFTVVTADKEEKTGTSYAYYHKAEGAIPAATAEGYLFVGWFMQTEGGWQQASEELLSAQNADVTLWAVWVQNDLSVTLTKVSASTKFGITTWTIEGSYAGGGIAAGKSQEIATAVGYTAQAAVRYSLSADGESEAATLQLGVYSNASGGAFSVKTVGANNAYGGAKVKITYVIGGISVTAESENVYRSK